MAHEVIKRVGTRAYRYRVESYRDPQTRKVRSRWTYLGVATHDPSEGAHAPKRRAPSTLPSTRERLIDAFERLVESGPPSAATAGAVAAEAKLAHGTFYRYFKDRRAILVAALDRVKEELERGSPTFGPPFGSRAEERARVRAWVGAFCRHMPARAGVLRALYEALEVDPELRAVRALRRRDRIRALRDYLDALERQGIVSGVRAEPLATALVTLVEAVFRQSVVEAKSADTTLAEGIEETFDRSVFGVDATAS